MSHIYIAVVKSRVCEHYQHSLYLNDVHKIIIIIIIIVTSFAPISSKIKLSGATKPGD